MLTFFASVLMSVLGLQPSHAVTYAVTVEQAVRGHRVQVSHLDVDAGGKESVVELERVGRDDAILVVTAGKAAKDGTPLHFTVFLVERGERTKKAEKDILTTGDNVVAELHDEYELGPIYRGSVSQPSPRD